jgi:glucosyl-dolichyl phosphate glucuronosyltransferase
VRQAPSACKQPACDISIVVPTFNRSLLLRRTLASLVSQRTDQFRYEILVVDNGSSDGTREVVESFARTCPRIRYLLETRQGVSAARNTGVSAATGAIVAFIDDDVEADTEWLSEVRRAFELYPDVDCVGGRIDGRFTEPPPGWMSRHHFGPLALQSEKSEKGLFRQFDSEHATACLMTANFACRRRVLEEVGGFSPEYLRDEDRELQLRLWSAGKRGLYVPQMVVTTEVPHERLTKEYHRRFRIRAGASHARMRYLDRIDRAGRLVRERPAGITLFGTPGFIYRSLIRHLARWAGCAATLRVKTAFYHETRVLYLASYVWTRYQEERRPASGKLLALSQFARRLLHHLQRWF